MCKLHNNLILDEFDVYFFCYYTLIIHSWIPLLLHTSNSQCPNIRKLQLSFEITIVAIVHEITLIFAYNNLIDVYHIFLFHPKPLY